MELVSFSTCLEDDFCHPCNITPMQLLWLLDVLLPGENTQLFRHWPWWRMIGKKYRIHFQDHLLLTANEKYIWMFSFFTLYCCPMWPRLCNYCQLNSQLVFITPEPEQGISKDLKESIFGFSCSRETLEKSQAWKENGTRIFDFQWAISAHTHFLCYHILEGLLKLMRQTNPHPSPEM